MDVRHLRNLLAVIAEGSLGRAARRLNISQPALTKSIQRLEEELGVPLFERDTRGMRPTFFAESLQGYAKAACINVADAEKQIAALRQGTEGTITIAGPPVIMTELLPEALVRIRQERPRLQVRVVSQNKGLFTELLDGKSSLVIAMLYNEIPKQGLATHWLFDDRLVLAMRPDHPLARRRKFKPRDLLEQKWVFGENDNWSQQRLKLYFEQHGLALPKGQVETRDPAVAKSFIMRSDHIGMLSRLRIERELVQGLLKCVEIDSPLMLRPIGIVHRADETISPAIRFLIRIIEDVCTRRRRSGKATSPKPRSRRR